MDIFRRHKRQWLGILLLFFIPLLLLYALEKQMKPLENAYQSASSGFQYKDNDGVWRDYDPALVREKATGTYWFKTVLPDNRWRDPYMYLVYVPNVRVYVDGELIYFYQSRFEYWVHPHFIRLPDDFSGKTLLLRADFERQPLYPGLFFIDSPLSLVINFLLQSVYRLLLTFVSVFVSIVSFILYLGRRQASYLYFSLFAFYIAQLCISRSWPLLGIFAPSSAFAYFQDVFLPIGSYFFLRFYENMFETRFYRIHRWLATFLLAAFAVWLIAAIFFPSFYLFEMSRIMQNVISPGIIAIVLVTSFQTYRKRQDAESFWLMAGIGTFSLTVLLYFLRPPLEWLFEKIFPGWLDISIFFEMMYEGDHFLHGMLILLYCMALVLRARIQSIYENAKKTAKKLKQLSDSLEQLVQERTKELEQANEHLRASMKKTAEALAEIAVLEDRNRIAQDMHDHAGHALTAALVQMEVAKNLVKKKETEQALEKLESARNSVASGLASIRETVLMMKIDYEERSLLLSIQQLIRETEAAVGVEIFYTPEPLPDMDPILKKTLYLALQEGLTNGIRHAKAKRFEFQLKAENGMIVFRLANDGKRYENQEFGFGLKTMRERVERFNGTLNIEATDEHSCVLTIMLPVNQSDEE